jgi:hypothetical protein
VEIGISNLARSVSIIEVAQRFATQSKVFYSGLDWFDARPMEWGILRLKQAHQALQPTAAGVRLVPGAFAASLAAVANAHQNTDLLLISHMADEVELEQAWFYVPRMLHAKSLVLREQHNADGQPFFTRISTAEVSERANRGTKRRAA